ncbi:hypothetical protein GQX73_g7940 [Xylaria multiplex]|uniref:Uncharacterized protein n=1 Tax=Xylaria multiplex TaxID=323545 RepID=A0A7C8IQA6_9PEZI|nr:hypothetical protein GQX73_g7940 [Xylaria multiplex]
MTSRMLFTSTRQIACFSLSRQAVVAQRSFSGSTMSLKHKESTGRFCLSDDHNSPQLLIMIGRGLIGDDYDPEKHKLDSLSKHKLGKGHWKPELASDSEEAVKADRTAKEDMTTLQNRTKATAEETSKTGTSMRDGL